MSDSLIAIFIIFYIQEEPGDNIFLLELHGLKNDYVTESSPVQSI